MMHPWHSVLTHEEHDLECIIYNELMTKYHLNMAFQIMMT